jgi:hypothetical protein
MRNFIELDGVSAIERDILIASRWAAAMAMKAISASAVWGADFNADTHRGRPSPAIVRINAPGYPKVVRDRLGREFVVHRGVDRATFRGMQSR